VDAVNISHKQTKKEEVSILNHAPQIYFLDYFLGLLSWELFFCLPPFRGCIVACSDTGHESDHMGTTHTAAFRGAALLCWLSGTYLRHTRTFSISISSFAHVYSMHDQADLYIFIHAYIMLHSHNRLAVIASHLAHRYCHASLSLSFFDSRTTSLISPALCVHH
jgi:hypothetical protein